MTAATRLDHLVATARAMLAAPNDLKARGAFAMATFNLDHLAAAIGSLAGPAFTEETCPGHVASYRDTKVCGRCGIHIDSLRPPEDDGPF